MNQTRYRRIFLIASSSGLMTETKENPGMISSCSIVPPGKRRSSLLTWRRSASNIPVYQGITWYVRVWTSSIVPMISISVICRMHHGPSLRQVPLPQTRRMLTSSGITWYGMDMMNWMAHLMCSSIPSLPAQLLFSRMTQHRAVRWIPPSPIPGWYGRTHNLKKEERRISSSAIFWPDPITFLLPIRWLIRDHQKSSKTGLSGRGYRLTGTGTSISSPSGLKNQIWWRVSLQTHPQEAARWQSPSTIPALASRHSGTGILAMETVLTNNTRSIPTPLPDPMMSLSWTEIPTRGLEKEKKHSWVSRPPPYAGSQPIQYPELLPSRSSSQMNRLASRNRGTGILVMEIPRIWNIRRISSATQEPTPSLWRWWTRMAIVRLRKTIWSWLPMQPGWPWIVKSRGYRSNRMTIARCWSLMGMYLHPLSWTPMDGYW